MPGNERDGRGSKTSCNRAGERKQKHSRLNSKLIEQANATAAAANKALWAQGTTHHTDHRRITTPSYVQFKNNLYDRLTRRDTTTLVRLRTGHCSLNNYLSRFQIIETPECQCRHTMENSAPLHCRVPSIRQPKK